MASSDYISVYELFIVGQTARCHIFALEAILRLNARDIVQIRYSNPGSSIRYCIAAI